MNYMSCWSLKYTQIKRRLLILLLSPLPKGTFVHVSRYNFFVISRSHSKCKIGVIHVSRLKKGKFTFTSKSSFTFHDVKKRLIHVHDMSYLAVRGGARGEVDVINVRNQFLFRFNVGKSYNSNRYI